MRDAVVEGFGNLDQLGFFYVHLNLSKRAASGALQAMHETEYISINLKKKTRKSVATQTHLHLFRRLKNR